MKTLLVVNALFYARDVVQMTEAGRTYCEKVVRHITWAEDTAMSMFSPEEQKHLIDLSRTFTKNLAMLVNQEMED